MAKLNHRTKLIIALSMTLIGVAGMLAYLYFTNRLPYILSFDWASLFESLSKTEKWIFGTVVVGILINLISAFLYNLIAPSPADDNTEEILNKQNELFELLKNSKLDPRDIERYIKELPIKEGINEVENNISEWYNERKINQNEKEILLVIISAIFKQNKGLTEEINRLKAQGKNEIALILETIQIYFGNGDASGIRNIYFERKEKLKQETILILKQSINSTEALYAYEETKQLYKELIEMESSAVNYFDFAYFSQKYNLFQDAEKYYEDALKIYRDLAEENSRTYLPDVAMTLNNLAILHSDKNEFTRALEEYDEALKIRRDLAEENSRTYLPDVAMTLNNLAILHSDKNEFTRALEEYDEALKICRDLAEENSRTYLPYVATTLNNLANLHKNKNEFTQALEEYDEALKICRDLAKENSRTYLPDVAMTLNNLAILHSDKNEFTRALEEYDEALKIYRDLAEENPEAFDIEYSQMLIMGVDLFGKEKEDLNEASRILKQYPNIYHAENLLAILRNLEHE